MDNYKEKCSTSLINNKVQMKTTLGCLLAKTRRMINIHHQSCGEKEHCAWGGGCQSATILKQHLKWKWFVNRASDQSVET